MAESSNQNVHNHSGAFSGMHSHDGGAPHWHDEFGEHYSEDMSDEEIAARQLDWKKHNLVLVTVGVDIGSSTSHLMFSRIFMQLVGDAPLVHTVVVGREIMWQSSIILTPYRPDGTIDAAELSAFVADAYHAVNASQDDIDTGAIILTGEALKRENARAIAEMFALETGKFVCAAAGHHLEAVLAANGSGTVARSRRDQRTLLNVDIGGGTTKLAVVQDGAILATAAIAIGARQIVKDEDRRVTRLDEPAQITARHLGIELALGEVLSAENEARIVETWIDLLAGLIDRRPVEGLTAELMLTDPLPDDAIPQAITFSGGVSEFIFFRETNDFGDLGKPLAAAIRKALSSGAISLPSIIDPNLGIRATAVGASMFTSQVGVNLFVSDESVLPLYNLPVLLPRLDLASIHEPATVATAISDALTRADLQEGEQPIALAFRWPEEEDVEQEQVRLLAQGIRDALPNTTAGASPLVLLIDQAVMVSIGRILKEELSVAGEVISLERIAVAEFDFIDLAPVVHPTEVVPITIKSLLFAGGLDRRSVKQALIAAATNRP